jgi:hypothetical protein
LTAHGILSATGFDLQDAKGRCDYNTDTISAWAAVQAAADEVEVPCREVGLTIRIQNLEFRIQNITTRHNE